MQKTTRRRRAREEDESDLPLLPSGYLHNDFVIPDEECDSGQEDSDYDEAFGPVRIRGVATKSPKRTLSAPITTDQEMAALNPIHRNIVEQFLILAKRESEEVSHLLSRQPVHLPCSHSLDTEF